MLCSGLQRAPESQNLVQLSKRHSRVRKLLRGGKVHPNRAHSGVWQSIATVLLQADFEVQIIKVVSHCQISAATTPEEKLASWHNQLTDQAATYVNEKREPEFWQAWKQLETALTDRRRLHVALLLMLLKQSRLATQDQPRSRPVQQVAHPGVTVAMPAVPAEWTMPTKLFKRYGRENVEAVHRWWAACGRPPISGREEMQMVAGLQLFLDFTWHTNHAGPCLHRKRWYSQPEGLPAGCVVMWGTGLRYFCCFGKLI